MNEERRSVASCVGAVALFAAAMLVLLSAAKAASATCYGNVANGSIDGAVPLPLRGSNYRRMSDGPISATRVYVHPLVRDVAVAAYEAVEAERPTVRFVYGETGLKGGGPIPPHKTHQNGLSVDFFVPVVDEDGEPVPFPAQQDTQYGYAIDFDSEGRYKHYRIDFAALAEHLFHLNAEAASRGVGIDLVILDRAFLPRLFATPRGPYLKKNVRFMQTEPWVRHDEHFHVDFSVACH